MEESTALETQKKLKIVPALKFSRVLCLEARPLESRVSSPSNTMVTPTPPVQTGPMRILHSQREPNGVPQRLTKMVFTSRASAIMGSVRPHLLALQHKYVFDFSLHKATTPHGHSVRKAIDSHLVIFQCYQPLASTFSTLFTYFFLIFLLFCFQ